MKKYFPSITAYLITLLSLSISSAIAEDLKPFTVKKTLSNGTFVFERADDKLPKRNIEIVEADGTGKIEVTVLKCSPKLCLGKFTNDKSSFRSGATYRFHEELIRQELPTPPSERSPEKTSLVYLGYGSALGPAVKGSYLQQVEDFFSMGGSVSLLGSTINKTKISGQLLTFAGRLKALPIFDNLSFNFMAELGLASVEMKYSVDGFTGVDKATTYIGYLGPELALDMGDFSIAAKMGLTKSGIKDKHKKNGEEVTNPYGKTLATVEVGLYYRF